MPDSSASSSIKTISFRIISHFSPFSYVFISLFLSRLTSSEMKQNAEKIAEEIYESKQFRLDETENDSGSRLYDVKLSHASLSSLETFRAFLSENQHLKVTLEKSLV